jgi:hypothetical protein
MMPPSGEHVRLYGSNGSASEHSSSASCDGKTHL